MPVDREIINKYSNDYASSYYRPRDIESHSFRHEGERRWGWGGGHHGYYGGGYPGYYGGYLGGYPGCYGGYGCGYGGYGGYYY